jgi:hypothetical protein
MPNYHDHYEAVVDELMAAKRTFHDAVAQAYAAGVPVNRLVKLVGFGTCRIVLGDGIVDPFDRQST